MLRNLMLLACLACAACFQAAPLRPAVRAVSSSAVDIQVGALKQTSQVHEARLLHRAR